MPYQKVIRIVEAWSAYEKTHTKPSLEGFGHWLVNQSRQGELSSFDRKEHPGTAEAIQDQAEATGRYIQRYSTLNQAGMLVGRLSRLSKLYFKKVFNEKSELSLEERVMLITALNLGPTRKTDLINHNLVEITTGTEMLRRLLKFGYLAETPNPNDARSKILNITEKGRELVYKSYPSLNLLNTLMFSVLSETEVLQLRELLAKVNDYHTPVYLDYRDEPLESYMKHFPLKYLDMG